MAMPHSVISATYVHDKRDSRYFIDDLLGIHGKTPEGRQNKIAYYKIIAGRGCICVILQGIGPEQVYSTVERGWAWFPRLLF